MRGRGNIPAQAERFEELHLNEFDGIFREDSEEPDSNWLDDIDIDDPTNEEIEAMIEALEGNKPDDAALALIRRFLVVQ